MTWSSNTTRDIVLTVAGADELEDLFSIMVEVPFLLLY
jgi:hypothetical protein